MHAKTLKLIHVTDFPVSITRAKVKDDPRFKGRNGSVTFTGNLDADYTTVLIDNNSSRRIIQQDKINWQPITIRAYDDTTRKIMDISVADAFSNIEQMVLHGGW